VAVFFGALLILLCLGLLVYALVRRKSATTSTERKAPHEES
jgi:hypothetical protein